MLVKRDYRKANGGQWELSAGGSVLKDEEPLVAAKREVFEETGIVVTNIMEIGRIIDRDRQTLYVEYVAVTNCRKESVILQEGETIAYYWANMSEILSMSADEIYCKRGLTILNNMDR